MADDDSLLRSGASTLDELLTQVVRLAETAAAEGREDRAAELWEVERTLRAGARQLQRLLR